MASKAPSLAAQSGTLSTGTVQLPAIFSAAPEKLKERFISPYLVFAHSNRTDEWKKLQAKYKQIEEGDMCLMRQDGPLLLPVAKVMMLAAKQAWTQDNAAGEMQAASFKEMPYPYRERIEAVLLLFLDTEIVPVNVTFKTTKCPAAKVLSEALLEAATPAWADRGPEFRDTLVIPQAFARFYGEMTVGTPRPGKQSGKLYRVTQCTIKPTTRVEAELFTAFSADPECQKKLDDAAARYQLRVTELTNKTPR